MNNERRLLQDALPGYDVADEIGRGGWGVVLEAQHRTLERRVAVKQLPRAFGADPDVRARFLAEARVVASLDHPHIVPLYDFVERDGMCLLVMEHLPDGTLWDRFEAGRVSPEVACAVAVAVLSALSHAHERGVLHRDVKPENVLFNSAGVPKLADFGIAKVLGEGSSNRTATGVIMGTPAYMAPEQGSGQPVSAATDVYAVGAVLYELLAGRLPFESTGDPLAQLYRHVHEPPAPLGEVAPSVPAVVCRAVEEALAKTPEERPADAATFAQRLDAAARTGFGPDWLRGSGVPILDTSMLRGGDGDPAAPRSSATVIVDRPATPPATPPPAAPSTPPPAAPSTPPPAAPSTPPPAAPSTPATPPPQAAPGPPSAPGPAPASRRTNLVVTLLAAAAVIAVVVAAGVVLLGDDGSDDPQASTDEVPAAAVGRFEGACSQSGVGDETCQCALDTALEELTPAQFLANDQLLRQDGHSLTAEVRQIFERCETADG